MKYLNGYTDPFISPVTGLLSVVQPLPDLQRGYIWIGEKHNRPLPTFKLIDLTIEVQSLQKQFDKLSQTSFVINTPNPILPKAQALSRLSDGLTKNVSGILEIAVANIDYLTPTLASGNLWIGNDSNFATRQPTITANNLPGLSEGKVWQGDKHNRPVEATIAVAPADALYIIKQPNKSLANAQSLNQLAGGHPKILKVADDGTIEVAIRDQDYATKKTLEEIRDEAEKFKNLASVSAAEASGAASIATSAAAGALGSALAAGVEAVSAAGSAKDASNDADHAASSASKASKSADHAAGSANNAAGSANNAAGSANNAAGSASNAAGSANNAASSAIAAASSASDAEGSATNASRSADLAASSVSNAAESATSAASSLYTLLHTGISLAGDVYGSGGLLEPIPMHFKDDPVLPGFGAMTIPQGGAFQRPVTPIAGMVRYNNGAG